MGNRLAALPDLIMREFRERGVDRYFLFGAALQAIMEGHLIPSPNPPEPFPTSAERTLEFADRWQWLLETTISALRDGTTFPNWAPWHRAIMIERNAFAKWVAQRLERKAKSRPAPADIKRAVSSIFAASKEKGDATPTQQMILGLVQVEYPDATRQQIRDAIRAYKPSKRGRPNKFAAGN